MDQGNTRAWLEGRWILFDCNKENRFCCHWATQTILASPILEIFCFKTFIVIIHFERNGQALLPNAKVASLKAALVRPQAIKL
jgi:hypothetical protein